jgi:PBP1b-binding outer membrane lipoprotein LpoB
MKLLFAMLPKAKLNAITPAIVLAAILFVSGCASVSAPEKSASLAAYEQLTPQADGTRSWRDPSVANIKAVRIDTKTITFASSLNLNDEQRQLLSVAMSDALIKQFTEAGIRVANASDTEALTLRANITSVEFASPTLNVVTTLLLFAPISRGGLSVEFEALSAIENKRVAAMAFSGTAGVNNFGSAFDSIGHAKLQTTIAATKFVALIAPLTQK